MKVTHYLKDDTVGMKEPAHLCFEFDNGEKSLLRLTPLYSETTETIHAVYEEIVKRFSGDVKDTTNREWNASQGVG